VRRRRGTRPRRAHAALPSRYDHCYPLFFLKKVASPLLFLISLPFANCNPNALLEFEYSFAPQHTDDRVQSESSYIL
jgi:hypothetical protein